MKLIRIILPILFFIATISAQKSGIALLDKSVVFDGKSRKQVVRFQNNSTDTLIYSISFVSRTMDSKGELIEDVSGVELFEASPYLRLYPRTVVVPPKALQSLALQLRPSTDMKPGEYRSHLYFEPVEDVSIVEEVIESGNNSVSPTVKIATGVAIPVSILVENPISKGSLGEITATDTTISVGVFREGNRSLRGSIDFNFIDKAGNLSHPIPLSVVLYREIDSLKKTFGFKEGVPKVGIFRFTLKIQGADGNDIVLDTKDIPASKAFGL